MILFGSVLLVLAVLGVVVYPVFRPRPAEATGDDTAADLVAQRDTLYTTLAELQMDYEMGNLSPADHQELEDKYKDKAVAVLREMDLTVEGSELDTVIEREVARMRRSARRTPGAERRAPGRQAGLVEDDIEKDVLGLRQARPQQAQPQAACPKCGAKAAAMAKFCADCGAALAVACPKCGAGASAEDQFCAQCGTNLKQGNK